MGAGVEGGRLPRGGAVGGSVASAEALELSVLLARSVVTAGTYTAAIWRCAAGSGGVTLS